MQEKADSELVRRQNRRVVLNALRQHGPLARIELGRATGLSPASITSIASQLIAEHILEELEQAFPHSVHRPNADGPSCGLASRSTAAHVLAVNISIDAVRLAIADFNGQILHRTSLAHADLYLPSAMRFGHDVADAIEAFLKTVGFSHRGIARIGIAMQGLADDKEGTLVWSPAFSAKNIPLTAPIIERFGIPCMIANDANMIAEGFSVRMTRQQPRHHSNHIHWLWRGHGLDH